MPELPRWTIPHVGYSRGSWLVHRPCVNPSAFPRRPPPLTRNSRYKALPPVSAFLRCPTRRGRHDPTFPPRPASAREVSSTCHPPSRCPRSPTRRTSRQRKDMLSFLSAPRPARLFRRPTCSENAPRAAAAARRNRELTVMIDGTTSRPVSRVSCMSWNMG